MPRTLEIQVFRFDELESSAKEKARDWFRQGIESEEIADMDDYSEIAGILGIEFKTQAVRLVGGGVRHEPCISWSGFSSQGDGASFDGYYKYAKGCAAKIRQHAPLDKRLAQIADDLQNAQRRCFYRLEARVSKSRNAGNYSHSGTMAVDVWDREDESRDIGDSEEGVREALRAFADWIYRQLEAQWEYLNSEESVDESIRANEYEFLEDGARA